MGGGEVTRLEKLEAVVGAARAFRDKIYHPLADHEWTQIKKRFYDALATLDAHTEAPQAVWPNGCTDPNSCGRSRTCNYVGCVHHGEDIGPVVKATLTQLQKMRPHTEAPQETVTLAAWRNPMGAVLFSVAGTSDDYGATDEWTRIGTFTLPLDREGGR